MIAETLRVPASAPRLIYTLDAAVCFAMGLAFMAFAQPLSALAGALPPTVLFWAGLVLLPWAAFNFYTARARSITPGIVTVHLAGDGAWIVGSIVVLAAFGGGLTVLGMLLVAGQALAVAGVFALKFATRHALG